MHTGNFSIDEIRASCFIFTALKKIYLVTLHPMQVVPVGAGGARCAAAPPKTLAAPMTIGCFQAPQSRDSTPGNPESGTNLWRTKAGLGNGFPGLWRTNHASPCSAIQLMQSLAILLPNKRPEHSDRAVTHGTTQEPQRV